MRNQNRKVCLLIDNFSGHYIPYEPKNIEIVFFEPNLTAFIQPLDAGVIRCFKAHYRNAFCMRALDLDEAGEHDIYKVDLLEAMLMAQEAWDSIEATTIQNCWNHTGIQREPILLRIPAIPAPTTTTLAKLHPAAFQVLETFAKTEMTLPQAENALKEVLGEAHAS